MTKALSLLFTALAVSSPVLGQSLAQKVADLRLAATAVDRVKLLADDEVSNWSHGNLSWEKNSNPLFSFPQCSSSLTSCIQYLERPMEVEDTQWGHQSLISRH